MEYIDIDTFKKLDIRMGTITHAEIVEGADKLLRLEVDFGEEKRQVVSGIRNYVEPHEIIGKQCPFAYNLEPRTIFGLESQGMIMAAGGDDSFALLHPHQSVPPGTAIH